MPTTTPTTVTVALSEREREIVHAALDSMQDSMRGFANGDELTEVSDLAARFEQPTHKGAPNMDCPMCGPAMAEANRTDDHARRYPDDQQARMNRRNALVAMQEIRERHYG